MGLKLTVTIVDTKKKLNFENLNLNLGGEIVKTENISPDDLHIGFYKDKIIILNEKLFEIIDDKPELNKFETELTDKFNDCEIVHLVQYDTIGMAGYVIIENGEKIRAKAVADGQLYLDDEKPTEYEISVGQNFKTAFLSEYPNSKMKVEEALKNKSPKEELIYLLELKNKILKDNETYFNGNLELEFMHKVIPHFIDSDWYGFCELEYVKYSGINYGMKNLKLIEFISDAFDKLKKMSTTHNNV